MKRLIFIKTWIIALLLFTISPRINSATVVAPRHQGPLAALMDLSTPRIGNDEPLPPDLAFPFHAESQDATTLIVDWNIVKGYYLYRDKIRLRLLDAPTGVSLGTLDLPRGDPKDDEFLGTVEIYHQPLQIHLPIHRPPGAKLALTLEASFQGCADGRLCYPPLTEIINLTLPPLIAPEVQERLLPSSQNLTPADAEPDQIARFLANSNRVLVLFWFFGMGLLLAFTPCVFPMIPILSSIIVGQGQELTTARSFLLSLVYVVAMAATYTVAGVVAGLVGTNFQIIFQEPWIIGTFSAIFVALALSMFGLYELQLPNRLQSHLTILANHQKGGTLVGVAVMGFLSALIVGPCVAPPLAGALIHISRSGDAVLGGLALFSMSMGMGTPLIIIGTTEGRWLPRAGAWMNVVKVVFGVLLLVISLEMLARILPPLPILLLWATLYIVCGVYLGALENLPTEVSGWQRLWKALGVVLLAQGVLVLTGAAMGGDNLWQPLRHISFPLPATVATTVNFQSVESADIDQILSRVNGRRVLLDFYADWCVECKRMERHTFSDPRIRAALADIVLLRVDVTKNTVADQALLRRFELFGPPALLFFGPDGIERRDVRMIGFMDTKQFSSHLEKNSLGCQDWTC